MVDTWTKISQGDVAILATVETPEAVGTAAAIGDGTKAAEMTMSTLSDRIASERQISQMTPLDRSILKRSPLHSIVEIRNSRTW